MIYKLFSLMALIIMLCPEFSVAFNANEIIQKVENNLNGNTAIMSITMRVKNKRTERTMKMKSYSEGKEKSFIQILYPGKDKGITFLKLDNTMWQYVPRIERTIKIPASMMLQSWMGSDFTNDDLVKESSISDDYTCTLLNESVTGYQLELLPREEAAVIWGKIIMEVSKQYYLPTSVNYFDEDNTLIRKLTYSEVKPFGDRYYPTKWLMLPQDADKVGHQTQMEISAATFDNEIDASFFTKRALKRYSR